MKQILYLLLSLMAAALLGLWHLQAPGNVTITWLGYEVQFSVAVGFIFFIILYFIVYTGLRLFFRIRSALSYCFSFFQKSKDNKENHSLPL